MYNKTIEIMTAKILTNYQIERETEKAMLISTLMIVGNKGTQKREFWMPKSQVNKLENGLAVATWLIRKNENIMYHTYFNDILRNEDGTIQIINS